METSQAFLSVTINRTLFNNLVNSVRTAGIKLDEYVEKLLQEALDARQQREARH